jgi:hypothetical protein
MRGNIVVNVLIAIGLIVLGWTLGQVCESYAFIKLDLSIGISDILAVFVEIVLAFIIVNVIENNAQNHRVEKDFFISELNEVQQTLTELEKSCSSSCPLSFTQTVYEISKSKKNLLGMWKVMSERDYNFHSQKNKDFEEIIGKIKLLNSQLTDADFFKAVNGYEPVKIVKGHIYINKTVNSELDMTFAEIKEGIFDMKIAINDM